MKLDKQASNLADQNTMVREGPLVGPSLSFVEVGQACQERAIIDAVHNGAFAVSRAR